MTQLRVVGSDVVTRDLAFLDIVEGGVMMAKAQMRVHGKEWVLLTRIGARQCYRDRELYEAIRARDCARYLEVAYQEILKSELGF